MKEPVRCACQILIHIYIIRSWQLRTSKQGLPRYLGSHLMFLLYSVQYCSHVSQSQTLQLHTPIPSRRRETGMTNATMVCL